MYTMLYKFHKLYIKNSHTKNKGFKILEYMKNNTKTRFKVVRP